MVGKGNIIFDIGEEGCPWGGSLSILKQAKKWKYPVAVAKLEKILIIESVIVVKSMD